MAVDHFLKITGIKGESQDAAHKNEIEVRFWSWGFANESSSGVGGGGAAGKATFEDLSIVKRVDRSSPRLAQACATGKHFPEAVLAVRRAGGPSFSLDFLVITLSDVTISTYRSSADEVESVPIDAFSIRFAKIQHSYTTQKADGTLDTPVEWTWDLKLGK
jgi:type VI secretion system secreted protein Hcp